MLATDEPNGLTPPAAAHEPAHGSLLEHWQQNERMRHVPPLSWILEKLDHDIRRRLEKLLVPYSDVPAADPRHAPIEQELRAVSRALDRVADFIRRGRSGHPPNEVTARVRWSLDHAVSNLTGADANTFGRRFPFQTLERSYSEPLWGAVLSVIQHVQNLVPLIRAVEPDIDESLYEGLVNLVEPMRREPIA
jgi:hypothetical protein